MVDLNDIGILFGTRKRSVQRDLSRTETRFYPKKCVSMERKSYTADLQYD